MKNQMRQNIVKVLTTVALCAGALGVSAAEQTQVAYGIKWTYLVSKGKAIITSNTKWVKQPESPVAIKIPETLGGCPVDKIRGLENLSSRNVRQLIVPEGVTSIEGTLGLGHFTNITLPKTLRVIGPAAFYKTFKGTQLTLPEGLESIGKEAFLGCEMTRISIPESVKEIGADAFKFCPIKTANIPKKMQVVPRGLFEYTELESITLHDGITEIGVGSFSNTHLKEVKMPSQLKKIGDYAFSGVEQLEQIEIPNGVTFIGRYAFRGCPALEKVVIPKSVNSIGQGAFAGWKNLTSVTIPDGFKHAIRDIFAYPFDWPDFQGGDDVPSDDIFTFIESPAIPSISSGKDSDGGDNDDDFDSSKIVGYQGDGVFSKVGAWMDKMWNEHTEAVCYGGVALIILMLICSAKKSNSEE